MAQFLLVETYFSLEPHCLDAFAHMDLCRVFWIFKTLMGLYENERPATISPPPLSPTASPREALRRIHGFRGEGRRQDDQREGHPGIPPGDQRRGLPVSLPLPTFIRWDFPVPPAISLSISVMSIRIVHPAFIFFAPPTRRTDFSVLFI